MIWTERRPQSLLKRGGWYCGTVISVSLKQQRRLTLASQSSSLKHNDNLSSTILTQTQLVHKHKYFKHKWRKITVTSKSHKKVEIIFVKLMVMIYILQTWTDGDVLVKTFDKRLSLVNGNKCSRLKLIFITKKSKI